MSDSIFVLLATLMFILYDLWILIVCYQYEKISK